MRIWPFEFLVLATKSPMTSRCSSGFCPILVSMRSSGLAVSGTEQPVVYGASRALFAVDIGSVPGAQLQNGLVIAGGSDASELSAY